ncbi:hypothetical protein ACFQY0_05275 [Haloferula chungangensis]|uniref:DUF4157 domain-containing protein n=1 Tax=Haloferula chungangensis TaxID=1048331 RepID=A0ABW2L4T9_9BACT
MAEKFDPSPSELAEHERAAMELTRLRRKGIHCHLENHPDGSQCHVDVVKDPEADIAAHGDAATPSASPGRPE